MALESKYEMLRSDRISTLEKVGLFVFILSERASNRDAQEQFQHFGETVSRIFKEVFFFLDN